MTAHGGESVAELEDRALVHSGLTAGRTRAVLVSVVLAVVLFVAFCMSVSIGDFAIPLLDVPPALVGLGTPEAAFIINELRLPRALTAVLVGAAFGLSGAIFQSLARNPLASPDIIGITAGASTAAVVMIVVLHAEGAALSMAALVGGLVTATAIYLLAWRRGVSAYRLVLVGIGMSAFLASVTSYLFTRADITEAERAAVWLTGSLHARDWEHVVPIAWSLTVLVPLTLLLIKPLRTLQLGDETAKGLGLRVEPARAALVFVGVALAAVATAAAGPVAFVAFVAAPVARRLVKAPLAVVAAGLVGALLVVLSDLVARRVFAPIELPVGVITGIIGAPYLLWLLARANRIGVGG
jgi:iron complex transport system permease protein